MSRGKRKQAGKKVHQNIYASESQAEKWLEKHMKDEARQAERGGQQPFRAEING